MSGLQRYTIYMDAEDGYDPYFIALPCSDGEWVKYDDIAKEIATLKGGAESWKELLETMAANPCTPAIPESLPGLLETMRHVIEKYEVKVRLSNRKIK